MTRACLLLPCVLAVLATAELYTDGVAETSEDIALRQLARYLEAQSPQHRAQHPHSLFPFLAGPARKKHYELGRQRERDLLEALDKTSLAEIVRYNDLMNRVRQREYVQPNVRLHIPQPDRETFKDENPEYQDTERHFYEADLDKGMKEEPIGYRGYGDFEGLEKDRETPEESEPEFTFRFDNSNLEEKHPFAVKPNDPRYYQDTPFSFDDNDKLDYGDTLKNNTKWERSETVVGKDQMTRLQEESMKDNEPKFNKVAMVAVSEPERQTEYHPLVVPVNHDLNNDIYFIAIVAGCSAAAMFALVLISLTWCRLQRGAKAAADIEYPAYGVTGPNKDVSPSGDQRLAQSAQMYHFQHQKQQIIAMENRASATRDPGSVSEAESDEENEEGDYTVYECPGLASTGEMEVKNPLFHDDPTPATPAQTNKEEDHM